MLGTSLRRVRWALYVRKWVRRGGEEKTYEALPGILVQEAHSDIEGRSTPALNGVSVGQSPACLLRDVDHVSGAETSGKKRLVSVTPGGIHDQATGVLPNSLGKGLRALLYNDVTPADGARNGGVERGPLWIFPVGELGDDGIGLETGFTNLTFDAAAVDCKVTKVSQELLGTVLTLDEFEEVRGIVNELKVNAGVSNLDIFVIDGYLQ